jgi:hypothetical protein
MSSNTGKKCKSAVLAEYDDREEVNRRLQKTENTKWQQFPFCRFEKSALDDILQRP